MARILSLTDRAESWLAGAMLLAVVAGIPLARTVAAARRSAAAAVRVERGFR